MAGWIRQRLAMDPDPGNGLPDRSFVPLAACSAIIHWVHTIKFTCHPGINRTVTLLQRYFW